MSRMIAEVVVDHDKVGLLGIGTLQTEVVPSSFSDRGYTINPPYRRLSFLPEMVEKDVLVEFYAKVNFIPVEVAREYMKQFFSEFKEILKERKSITLPGLGRLRATKENNFFFVPDEQLDIFPETFGMEPVSLKSLSNSEEKLEIQFEFKVPDKILEPQGDVDELQENRESATEQEQSLGADKIREVVREEETEQKTEVVEGKETWTEAQPEQKVEIVEESPKAGVVVGEAGTEASQEKQVEVVEKEKAETESELEQTEEEQELIYMESMKSERFKTACWNYVWGFILILVLALVVFIALVQLAPGLVDSLLYSPEQLEIINRGEFT